MSPAPHRPTADPQEIIADLQRELAVCRAELDQRTAELSDALEQQTAAAEVLGVINSSPGDLAPVFDSMLDKALRLCGADFSNLLRYDGKLFHVASAVHGNREIGERNRGRAPFPPPPGGLLHPILQGEDVVYVEDLLHDPAYHSVAEIREMVDRGGYRSLLNVALRKDTALLGVIGIFPKGVAAVRRQTDRTLAQFRRPGGHRDGERAALDRDARGFRAADRDGRGVGRHQFLARQSPASI